MVDQVRLKACTSIVREVNDELRQASTLELVEGVLDVRLELEEVVRLERTYKHLRRNVSRAQRRAQRTRALPHRSSCLGGCTT